MRKITRPLAFFTALVSVAALLLSVTPLAFAIGEGQIEGGDIYRIRNITKNTGFSNTQTADRCNEVQYKIRLHNPGPGIVSGVNVRVNLPQTASTVNVSTATISGQNMQPSTTTATATLNISTAETVSYISGSTQLLDTNSNVLQNLPDGIIGGGVTVGTVGVSIQEIRFVQFRANIGCPPPPPVVSSGVCSLLTLDVVNQREREVRATLAGQTDNATITAYRIDFGDGTVKNEATATHKYARDGTYTVTGTVTIRLADGSVVERTATSCQRQITFKPDEPPVVPPVTPPTTPPVTPASVTKLPDTGPGDITAIFLVVSSLGSIGYYVVSRRFFGV